MAIDAIVLVIEFLLGPIFLLVHLLEIPTAFAETGHLVDVATSGNVNGAIEAFLAGEYDAAAGTFSSLLGTVLWIGIVAGTVGEFGELGEVGELIEKCG